MQSHTRVDPLSLDGKWWIASLIVGAFALPRRTPRTPLTPLPSACRRAQMKAGIMGLENEAGEDAGDAGDVGDGQKKASH